MNKAYLRYLYKSRKVFITFFYVLFLALTFSSFLGESQDHFFMLRSALLNGFFGSVLLAFGLPLLQFAFVHSKRSVDCYFALPLKRKEQWLTNIIFIWLTSYGLFLLSALGTILCWRGEYLDTGAILLYLVIPAFLLLTITLCSSAWYLLANNLFDGMVMVGAYACMPMLLSFLICQFSRSYIAGAPYDMDWILTYLSPLFLSAKVVFILIDNLPLEKIKYLSDFQPWLAAILVSIYGEIGALISYFNFVSRRVERAEQVSNEWLAYPFVITFFTTTLLMSLTFYPAGSETLLHMLRKNAMLYLAILLIYTLATFVYRRKIEISHTTVLIFVCSFVSALLLGYLGNVTRGFGIADALSMPRQNVSYFYYGNLNHRDYALFSKKQTVEGKPYVGIDFSMEIKESVSAKQLDALRILDKLQKQSIEDFYDPQYGINDPYPYHIGNLSVQQHQGNILSHRLTYDVYHFLSLEDLKVLDESGKLVIEVSADNFYETYSYQDFIHKYMR